MGANVCGMDADAVEMCGPDVGPQDMCGADVAPAKARVPAMTTEAVRQIAAINPKRNILFAFIRVWVSSKLDTIKPPELRNFTVVD